MKMNAKKLTLALVALLLALTCVFAACGKKDEPAKETNTDKEPTVINNYYNTDCDCPDQISQEDLIAIAQQFKDEFNANYLGLYPDDVATALEALKDEALLKIAASANKEEAEAVKADYIAQLKAAKTFIDVVDELIADVNEGGVALADEEDINALTVYNQKLLDAAAIAAGNKKVKLDEYKNSDAPETVEAMVKRLRDLKLAKLAADASVNALINDKLAKVEAAPDFVDDDYYEQNPDKLTFKDFEELLALKAAIDTFARIHDLNDTTDDDGNFIEDAYAEIIKIDDYNTAYDTFYTKTRALKDDGEPCYPQIYRAFDVKEAAEALVKAARTYAYAKDADDDSFNVSVALTFAENTEGPFYWVLTETFDEGTEGYEGLEAPVKVTEKDGEVSVWIEKEDLFSGTFIEAMHHFDTDYRYLMQVTVAGDAEGSDIIVVTFPVNTKYKLYAEMQAAAEKAAEKVTEWALLIDQAGNEDLDESVINQYLYEIIYPILEDYNASIKEAHDAYIAFAEGLVLMNYVDEYPVKDDSYEEYVTGQDETRAKLYDLIFNLRNLSKTADGANGYNFFTAEEYDLLETYDVDLHENTDGTYTPAVFYKTFTYRWLINVLSRAVDEDGNAVQEEVTLGNTNPIDFILANVEKYFRGELTEQDPSAYEDAQALKAWVAKYIPDASVAEFDLAPFKTVQTEKVFADLAEDEVVAFGDVKFTFTNDDVLTEVADQVIAILNGEAVNATPAAPEKTYNVYTDINVAQAAIDEYERLYNEMLATVAALKTAVREIFVPGNADAIDAAIALYEETVAKYPADPFAQLYPEVDFDYEELYEILDTAKAIQNAALDLYPKAAWDEALGELKADYDDATDALANINALIEKYDELLEAEKEYLAYLEAGYSIVWEEGTENEDHLIDKDAVDAQKELIATLEAWKEILTDVDSFKSKNDNIIDDGSEAVKEATPGYLSNYHTPYLMAKFAKVEDEELARALRKILKGDEGFIDLDAAQADFDAAKAAYEGAKDAFTFALESAKSYADLEALDALIAQIEALVANADDYFNNELSSFDYLNLSTKNVYTDATVDLFSQIFNERVLAGRYRSIVRVVEYAELKLADAGVTDINYEALFDYFETAWKAYAEEKVAREDLTANETYTSIAAGKRDVRDAWRFKADYEWAVNAINAYAEDDIATYEELVFEEKNGEAGFQFDTEDVPGYLITGELPNPTGGDGN